MTQEQKLGVDLHDVLDAGDVEGVTRQRVLPQLPAPELGIFHLVRAEVDEVCVDEVSPVRNGDSLVLQLVPTHVDQGLDLLVTRSSRKLARPDVPDLEEVDERDLIFLVVKVEKEAIYVNNNQFEKCSQDYDVPRTVTSTQQVILLVRRLLDLVELSEVTDGCNHRSFDSLSLSVFPLLFHKIDFSL